MAYEIPGFTLGTRPAGADLTTKQYFFVKLNSSENAVLAGDGEFAIGALQNKPDSGQAAQIMIDGVTKILCGGSVTGGGPVASDAAGKCVNAAGGDVVLGTALEDGSDGQIISVLLQTKSVTGATGATGPTGPTGPA